MLYYENFDLVNVKTPVNAEELERLLQETHYDHTKMQYLMKGFREGFRLGYAGSKKIQQCSPNLKLTVGDETDLWNKVMKEVQLERYAGPYKQIPYKYFIQSPIGLVPKDGGKNTRLIFHLLYPRGPGSTSVNANTPPELCKVKYPDFADAIKLCIKLGGSRQKPVYISRSDVSAAFRNFKK